MYKQKINLNRRKFSDVRQERLPMKITAVLPQKRNANRSSVFIDGVFAFGVRNEDLASLSIAPGREITRERLEALTAEKIYADARESALKYLSARPRTFRETVKRLEEYEYPSDVITRVMELLLKYNYIDDKQYAFDYSASRLKSGKYGPRRVKNELKQKGVEADLIDEAFENAASVYDETEAAREWLRKKRFSINEADAAGRKRVSDALARRGFSWSAIREALNGDEDE